MARADDKWATSSFNRRLCDRDGQRKAKRESKKAEFEVRSTPCTQAKPMYLRITERVTPITVI
jgi:hypothetical protein